MIAYLQVGYSMSFNYDDKILNSPSISYVFRFSVRVLLQYFFKVSPVFVKTSFQELTVLYCISITKLNPTHIYTPTYLILHDVN